MSRAELTPDTLTLRDLPPNILAEIDAIEDGVAAAATEAAGMPDSVAGVPLRPEAFTRYFKFAAWTNSERGRAWIAEENDRRRQADDADARARLIKKLGARGIPEERSLRLALLSGPRPTASLDAVREAIAWREREGQDPALGRPGLVVVLAGPCGVGKTVAAAHAVLRHPRHALFVPSASVAGCLRNGWSGNEEKWQGWASVDLLALDEFGAEVSAVPSVELIALRFNAGKATIVPTNLSKQEFEKRLADTPSVARLADRIETQGRPWWVPAEGTSLRGMWRAA